MLVTREGNKVIGPIRIAVSATISRLTEPVSIVFAAGVAKDFKEAKPLPYLLRVLFEIVGLTLTQVGVAANDQYAFAKDQKEDVT